MIGSVGCNFRIYQHYFEFRREVSSILNPRSGIWIMTNDLASVRLWPTHSVDGDALSTVCFYFR